MNRRSFLTTCIATFTAPAIVRASSLMPLSVPKPQPWLYCTDPRANLEQFGLIYVDWRAGSIVERLGVPAGAGTGADWANAYTNLETALLHRPDAKVFLVR